MPTTEEEKKIKREYMREYRKGKCRKEEGQKYYKENKTNILKKQKEKWDNDEEWKQNKIREQLKYKENNREKVLRRDRLSTWKRRGVVGDLVKIHDEIYLPCNNCMVCNVFIECKNKHLDHDHETGEFRNVLCCSCNTLDNWKNKI